LQHSLQSVNTVTQHKQGEDKNVFTTGLILQPITSSIFFRLPKAVNL